MPDVIAFPGATPPPPALYRCDECSGLTPYVPSEADVAEWDSAIPGWVYRKVRLCGGCFDTALTSPQSSSHSDGEDDDLDDLPF